MQNHLDSLSPLAGEMGTFQVPEREICLPTTPTTLFFINRLYLKQLETVHYRIQARSDSNRSGPVPNRYTIHQTTPQVL